MSDYKVTKKRGKSVITDVDGGILPPGEAAQIAQMLLEVSQSKTYVYFASDGRDHIYKIGYTDDLKRRKSQLNVEFAHVIECDPFGEYSGPVVEQALHNLFGNVYGLRVEREWFAITKDGITTMDAFCQNGKQAMKFIERILHFTPEFERLEQEYGYRAMSKYVAGLIFGKYTPEQCALAFYHFRLRAYIKLKEGSREGWDYLDIIEALLIDLRVAKEEQQKSDNVKIAAQENTQVWIDNLLSQCSTE